MRDDLRRHRLAVDEQRRGASGTAQQVRDRVIGRGIPPEHDGSHRTRRGGIEEASVSIPAVDEAGRVAHPSDRAASQPLQVRAPLFVCRVLVHPYGGHRPPVPAPQRDAPRDLVAFALNLVDGLARGKPTLPDGTAARLVRPLWSFVSAR